MKRAVARDGPGGAMQNEKNGTDGLRDAVSGEAPGLWALWVSFAKMGAVLIGGGYALLPLLEREIVVRRKWAASEEMMDLYALAQVLPGIIAVNTSMLVGNRLRGLPGTLVAAAGLTAPPFVMIAAYAAAYGALRDTAVFSRALAGVQSAVAGMILALGVDMVRKALRPRGGVAGRPAVFAALAAAAMLFWGISFVWLIAFAAISGLSLHFLSVRRAGRC